MMCFAFLDVKKHMGLNFEKMKLVLRVAVCVKFRVMFDTVYQVTMSLELCHKERNNVLSL